MAKKKISWIILDQCDEIEERCDGYREKIIGVIDDILEHERGHRVSATNIQKQINKRFNDAAQFLAEQRGHHTS